MFDIDNALLEYERKRSSLLMLEEIEKLITAGWKIEFRTAHDKWNEVTARHNTLKNVNAIEKDVALALYRVYNKIFDKN